jgi:hypothetical protein
MGKKAVQTEETPQGQQQGDRIYMSIAARDQAFCELIKLIPRDVYFHTTTADGIADQADEDEEEVSNR